jgi:hypothetical protein
MSNQFFDPEDPNRVNTSIPYRPERAQPRPVSELRDNSPVWVPPVSKGHSDLKNQVDHVVRRILPIAGFLILAGLFVSIAVFIAGVYF